MRRYCIADCGKGSARIKTEEKKISDLMERGGCDRKMKRKQFDIPKTTSLTIREYREFLEQIQGLELKDRSAVRECLREGIRWWNTIDDMRAIAALRNEPEKEKLLKNELRYLKDQIFLLEAAEKKAKWM